MIRKLLLASLALACVALIICLFAPFIAIGSIAVLHVLTSTAHAAELATAGDTAVILPWGQWVVAIAETAKEVLVPILIAVASWAVGKAPWWVSMWLTTQRVDRMVRLAADYAVNAVSGAAHDKAASFDVGSKLLKVGLERALGSSPAWVLEAAGGPKGITERLFRTFRFDETVSDANTLSPVIASLPNLPFVDPLQAPPVPMSDR